MELEIAQRVHEYYWENDYSCAEVTLRILKQLYPAGVDQALLDATFGLNAGRCALQCGLVQGALLFLGVYGRKQGLTDDALRALCRAYCSAFEARFGSLLCRELRPEGFGPQNPPHLCEARTVEAVKFSAKFVRKHLVRQSEYETMNLFL